MRKFFKRLFKSRNIAVVYKGGETRKFKSFEKAVAYMLEG